MDPDSFFSLFIVVTMILLGTYFSATETAFSALNRVRVKSLGDEDPKRSRRANLVLRLHDDFDKLLSTLLVLNNTVTLISAAVATVLFIRIFGEETGPVLSTVILTIIIVFFGDITPKSLAKESPERVAMACAPLLYVFVSILSPVNYLFTKWKAILGRIVTVSDDRMTEEELYTYVEVAQNDGIINEEDKTLIENAIEFKGQTAGEILTPRIDVSGISEDTGAEEIAALFLETGYSRLPVYTESMDHIIGVVHMRDFFSYYIKGKNTNLSDIFSPPLFVAPSTQISDVFKLLQVHKSHFAVVTDEYGGTAGIVTLEDILEELVGDIWDESDDVIITFEPLGDNRHKIICSAYVKDLFAYLNISENIEADSTTVSGWIMDELRKVPEEGDTFRFRDLTVTVLKTEHRRVIECVIEINEEKPENEKEPEE